MKNVIPLVSVCIPLYNGEEFIVDCIKAVQEQDFYELEIIVVDDCSTDSSYKIVELMAKYDHRIRLYKNSKNLGLVKNWERCMQLVNTDWIKFIFQDDYLMPHAIKNLYSSCVLDNTKVAIGSRRYVMDSNADPSVANYILNDLLKLEDYYELSTKIGSSEIHNIIAKHPLMNIFGEPSSWLFHSSVVENVGTFNQSLSQVLDYEFMARICSNYDLSFVRKPINFFRIHGSSETHKNKSSEKGSVLNEKIEFVDAIILLFDFLNAKYYEKLRDDQLIYLAILDKYQMELAKGLNQLGEEKFFKLLKEFAPSSEEIINEISESFQSNTIYA